MSEAAAVQRDAQRNTHLYMSAYCWLSLAGSLAFLPACVDVPQPILEFAKRCSSYL